MQGETLEQATERLIDDQVFCCQSSLVEEALKQDWFQFNDISNLYETCKDSGETLCLDCKRHDGCSQEELKEVFEWYAVSTWLGKELIKRGAVVLDNDYGVWYGRECTGQAMSMDNSELKDIAKEIYL